MTTAKDVMKLIKDNDVKYVDFRFTDPRGKWQHVTFDVTMIEEDTFSEGVMFDGSSIAGWKAIHESDMNLMPDAASACIDPFYAETATFMPKPIYGDNGSGMHCHQSIWKGGKPTFAGNKYSDLSDTCLWYIAGIIKHARAINAFSNPTTNSYKRLVPGFEAPVLLAYSVRNRSASCRIPLASSAKGKRVEVRFPDPLCNPYLGFAAMLMAGLDGIKNKLDPGSAVDKDLYDLPPQELKQIPTVCGSLRQALEEVDKDRSFLKVGGVFNDDFIDSYIELKMTEVIRFEHTPHPLEFVMYYSA